MLERLSVPQTNAPGQQHSKRPANEDVERRAAA
jgi:hypothetical protein